MEFFGYLKSKIFGGKLTEEDESDNSVEENESDDHTFVGNEARNPLEELNDKILESSEKEEHEIKEEPKIEANFGFNEQVLQRVPSVELKTALESSEDIGKNVRINLENEIIKEKQQNSSEQYDLHKTGNNQKEENYSTQENNTLTEEIAFHSRLLSTEQNRMLKDEDLYRIIKVEKVQQDEVYLPTQTIEKEQLYLLCKDLGFGSYCSSKFDAVNFSMLNEM